MANQKCIEEKSCFYFNRKGGPGEIIAGRKKRKSKVPSPLLGGGRRKGRKLFFSAKKKMPGRGGEVSLIGKLKVRGGGERGGEKLCSWNGGEPKESSAAGKGGKKQIYSNPLLGTSIKKEREGKRGSSSYSRGATKL